MNYSVKDLKLLWSRSGGFCAFPECSQEVTCPINDTTIGVICHIVGKRKNSPRSYINFPEFPQNNLDKYGNLILLCPTHHRTIDDDETTYTIDKLREIKSNHENWVTEKLKLGKAWECNISQLSFINIPRLAILAGLKGFSIDTSVIDQNQNLHSLGWEINKLMIVFESLLNEIHPRTINLNEINEFNKDHIGATISFSTNVRTKGVPGPDYYNNQKGKLLIGDPDKGPQIYFRIKQWKVILPIDPRWITTTTAFVQFRSGHCLFAGLCTIKQIKLDKKIVIATPLVLGTPKGFWDQL